MNQLALVSGAIFGALAVVIGAFGAHALKKIATSEQLNSFETGVKYQIYHALFLLFMGQQFSFESPIETYAVLCILMGTLLFSFSIYGLVLSSIKNKKLKFLGPITPLGGLLLTIGWVLSCISFL
ncbi:DUF423 domain-containing protein [Flavicella sediminum]|uniref:DUF423 domain-containing protein n=1 Tax=Flavicella sediminum TaxID=2585141 RepID=UPI00111FDBB2|nr:DUF423 domain-containing protein [Flavicella sediminum]